MYWLTLYITALAWASSVSAIDCTGIKAVSPQCSSAESAYTRDTFFVGGEYIPYNGTYQSIYSDQLYVEKLTPVGGVSQKNPLVFISAGVPTGAVSTIDYVKTIQLMRYRSGLTHPTTEKDGHLSSSMLDILYISLT